MPGWHNALCNSSKDFGEGSDIDAAAALEKVCTIKVTWSIYGCKVIRSKF